jgi:DNA polymerase-3 subunit epsilon
MGYTLAFDIESTHLNTEDGRIVSLCMTRDDTGEKYYTTVNPDIPIPSDSTEVHGLTDADVADSPSFRDILPVIEKFLDSANVLHAYNGHRFDVYILQAELTRAGSNHSVLKMPLVDNLRVWQEGEPRSLEDASKRWLGHGIEEAHNASADVDAMLAIDGEMRKEFGFDYMTDLELAAMLKGDNVTPDGKFLWEDGRVMMHWSKKHFGKPVIEVARIDPDFFQFVLSKDGDWLNHGVRSVSINAIRNSTDEEAFNSWVISEFGPPPEKEEEPERKRSDGGPTPHKIAETEAEAEAMQNYMEAYGEEIAEAEAEAMQNYMEAYGEEIAEAEAEHRYNMQQGQ